MQRRSVGHKICHREGGWASETEDGKGGASVKRRGVNMVGADVKAARWEHGGDESKGLGGGQGK